ncbi:MAG: hypothetical protein Hyperionvirus3_34 [Hyperionvirus sp.]|uniref:Uncharacterized protein n=1 Tax=Hyperionvirus sp. TaxID=2487770 RepID=A0A3G5A6T6_9VIRU|nr:MAG: hypothetical protein Hyperionvirus3_34 [Hyperionvirus sp.]
MVKNCKNNNYFSDSERMNRDSQRQSISEYIDPPLPSLGYSSYRLTVDGDTSISVNDEGRDFSSTSKICKYIRDSFILTRIEGVINNINVKSITISQVHFTSPACILGVERDIIIIPMTASMEHEFHYYLEFSNIIFRANFNEVTMLATINITPLFS